MNLPFSENSFHLVTAFETIYFWPGIQVAFSKYIVCLKMEELSLICNESNGKNTKDEKMDRYNPRHDNLYFRADEKALKNAGFSKIQVEQNEKGWALCDLQKR